MDHPFVMHAAKSSTGGSLFLNTCVVALDVPIITMRTLMWDLDWERIRYDEAGVEELKFFVAMT